jgi:DNA-binding CsgD family transcriptional regulator
MSSVFEGAFVNCGRPRTDKILRSAFGLTPTEAKVAISIARGRSPATIAVAHRVSVATIRTQLKSVYAKTRTHRQSELAAFVGRIRISYN